MANSPALQLIGTIHVPGVMTDERWAAVVASQPQLAPTDAIEVLNPFTEEPDTIAAPGELALVTLEGKEVGALRWCRLGTGIDVFGESRLVLPVANQVAKELEGSFEPM